MLRRARTTVARLSTAALALTLTVSLGATAQAGPKESLAQTKRDIAAAKVQLADLQQQAETAAEHYNDGMLALAQAKRAAADRQQAATLSQRKLVAMRAQLSVFAVQMYKGGDPTGLTLIDEAQDPQEFVDRAAYSNQLSQQKAATLAALDQAEHDAAVTAEAAKQAVAAQRAVVAKLADAKRQVDEASQQAQQVLTELQAKQRQLIHQIQVAAAKAAAERRAREAAAARRAAERARQEALALDRQREAARAAQQSFDSQPADPAPAPAPSGGSSSSGGSAAHTAVQWAYRELGKPYVWAASGPNSFDCSGLTMYVYARAGVYLPHSSGAQYGYGHHVSRGELQPGDLVFFGSPIHHVGIYVGGGNMIEAPHTGADVRVAGVDRPDYVGATRVVG